MAGLAADTDFRPRGVEAIVGSVVILPYAGRMALGAHEVPVLIELGPVQHVVVLDLLIGVEMKPALAALVLRPAVPGDGERLYPAVGKFDQVLLQGIDAECVFHFEGRKFAVGTVGLDEEFVILFEKAGMNAKIVEPGIIEIAKYGSGGSVLHGMPVLGFFP